MRAKGRKGYNLVRLIDYKPKNNNIIEDIIEGLKRKQKTLPCKYLYDQTGSKLFDQICNLPEYYPTRTELKIMQAHINEIASLLEDQCMLIELGSGSSSKTEPLLEAMTWPRAYVPIDISKEHLIESSQRIQLRFPDIEVLPIYADFHQEILLPQPIGEVKKKVVYFPGSTIGNLHREEAKNFLHRISEWCGHGGGLLIGVDLRKDSEILEAAYNDQEGITGEFNLNMLKHLNRLSGSNFSLECYQHDARWNEHVGRIEMHLVCKEDHTIRINGHRFIIKQGESICSECSYKYSLDEFAETAAGFRIKRVWTDDEHLFSVQYLERE